jgi:cysteine desulfurase
MNRSVYLDYAATTPLDPRVLAATAPFHDARNAASSHAAGRAAAEAVEVARRHVAGLVGGNPGEVVFTSGATESDNLAIGGTLRADPAGHVVTTAAEHKAVLQTVREWCPSSTIVPVLPDGSVDPDRISEAIRPDTVLVSVMAANNEVGTVSHLAEIGAICRERGVLLHSDAAQAAGKMALDVQAVPVDLVSLSAHKIYGPKGVGALWVRREIRHRVKPLIFGGDHERGLRSGTTNVAGCVGFGEAARLARVEFDQDASDSWDLRRHLIRKVGEAFGTSDLNGAPDRTLPGIVNIHVPGIDAESWLLATPSVAASTGSACTSASPEPSHVLLAMGLSHEAASQCIRFSFGRYTTRDEIGDAIAALSSSADQVRNSAAEVSAC